MPGSLLSVASSASVAGRLGARDAVPTGRRLRLALWALAASVPLETQAGVLGQGRDVSCGIGSLQHVGSTVRIAPGRILQRISRPSATSMSFVIGWRRDTTREPWAASWPARPTCRPAERRSCRWESWEASSRATRFWARRCATTTSPCGRMAEDALWAVWFRADTAEHNQILEQVRHSIRREQLEEAETTGHAADRRCARIRRGLQPAGFRLFSSGAVRRECRRLPAGPRSQPVSHRSDRGTGEMPAQSEPSP